MYYDMVYKGKETVYICVVQRERGVRENGKRKFKYSQNY
jgi:hypothetical protein